MNDPIVGFGNGELVREAGTGTGALWVSCGSLVVGFSREGGKEESLLGGGERGEEEDDEEEEKDDGMECGEFKVDGCFKEFPGVGRLGAFPRFTIKVVMRP